MALDETSFDFEEGQLISFLGPSGCGKTTLLRIIAGLIPKTSGAVTIGNLDVDGPVGNYGFVFQSPSLMPWRSVLDNVMFPIEILRQRDSSARQRANELLELVGLSAFTESRPHQLSGGMQQRVALCRALVHRPKLLLMDEPFGALDEFTRNRLDDDLVRLWWERKLTTVFVTHSIYEAVFLSTRIVVLAANPGRIFRTMTIDEPQPRNQDFRDSPRFAAYCRELSTWLAEASLPSTSGATP